MIMSSQAPAAAAGQLGDHNTVEAVAAAACHRLVRSGIAVMTPREALAMAAAAAAAAAWRVVMKSPASSLVGEPSPPH